MTENTLLDWSDRIAPIDYAFQPIVNIHTGACYGYEALIRNVEDAGFKSINAFFDRAFESNMLYSIDLLIRQKAQKKFTQIEGFQNTKLFYNLDNRMFEGEACNFDEAFTIDDRIDLPISNLCFEVSERHELSNLQDKAGILNDCRKQGYKIAVDDCGIGFSGMQRISSPDEMGNCIADLKKEAKKSPERSRHVTLQDVCPPPVLHMEKARHARLVS